MQRDELISLLSRYRLKPTKQLGQHYLIDEAILDRTLEAAQIKDGELILEIGAGPGILTQALARAGADVLAVEYDRNFCRLLQDEYHNWRNVHVLCDDALRLDFSDLQRDGVPYKKIVANIPYQITNPLVRKILEPGSQIEMAVLLMQKEVADRLMAPPGSSDRGILTVMVEYYGSIERVVHVPPTAFWPSPQVDSTVIKIVRPSGQARPLSDTATENAFFWLVKQGMSGKRKTLINSLSGGLQLAKPTVNAIVETADLDPMFRAEDLDLAGWLRLFAAYRQLAEDKQGGKNGQARE